jgi:site-specific recombinase XerD
MAVLSVLRGTAPFHFRVVDANGNDQPDITSYLRHLALNGCSPYTLRSYAFGLTHFHIWLGRRELASLSPIDIADYISHWRSSPKPPAPATSNHRLTVISGYFGFLNQSRSTHPDWMHKKNPVPAIDRTARQIPLRARHRYARADLRRRVPQPAPRHLNPDEILRLSGAAQSWRDRALLALLEWSGQRIGDWNEVHGRHGILGLALSDIDQTNRTITVFLKGARASHTVPVGEAFWPPYREYLRLERGKRSHDAAWISLRSGKGQILRYATFETAFRDLCRRAGINGVSAHSFRHSFAQNLLDTTDNLALVQAFLAHSSPETTAATYLDVPFERLITAIRQLEDRAALSAVAQTEPGYAFDYDPASVAELERLFKGNDHD